MHIIYLIFIWQQKQNICMVLVSLSVDTSFLSKNNAIRNLPYPPLPNEGDLSHRGPRCWHTCMQIRDLYLIYTPSSNQSMYIYICVHVHEFFLRQKRQLFLFNLSKAVSCISFMCICLRHRLSSTSGKKHANCDSWLESRRHIFISDVCLLVGV